MKTRVANMLVCRHFDNWLESIDDPSVKELVRKNTIMTGGALVTLITENRVNDFDFYFRNRETALAVANYYVAKFKANPPTRFRNNSDMTVAIYVEDTPERVKIVVKSAGVATESPDEAHAYFEGDPDPEAAQKFLDNAIKVNVDAQPKDTEGKDRPKFRPVFLTANAITLSDKTQIVIRFWGEPDEIHENYDFVHCTLAWTSWERRVRTNADALECILTKELRYIGSRYPLCSMFRVRKFIERGWTITAGQLVKIAFQINALNLNDYATLEEQLTGVDHAYFMQLLGALREKSPDKVDQTYLMELIDRMV